MVRRKDLAGIAALAGIGMLLANRSKKDGVSEGQSRANRDASEVPDNSDGITDDMRKRAFDEGNKVSEGERVSRYKPNPFDVEDARTPDMPTVKPGGGLAATVTPALKPMAERYQPAAARPNPNYSNEGRKAPVGQAPASSSKYPDIRGSAADSERANMRKNIREGSQAVEGVYPESNFIAPGLKAAQSAIKGIASRFGGDSAKAASPFLKELPYGGAKQLPNAPTKQLTGPSKADLMARDRAARATGRNEEMARENARRYGLNPDDMSATTSSLLRKNMGGDDFSLPLKTGGMAKRYASGGSVSSASSRADGIASKGKTRGKIY